MLWSMQKEHVECPSVAVNMEPSTFPHGSEVWIIYVTYNSKVIDR